MLRILKVKADGYRLFKDDFEINLSNSTKVFESELDTECFLIDKGVYSFNTISFVGANSSGKSTILNLLLNVFSYLKEGRWGYNAFDFRKNRIKIEIVFYLDGNLFLYKTDLLKNDSLDSPNRIKFCLIENEKLYSIKFDKNRGSSNLNRFEALDGVNDVSKEYLSKSLADTSSIYILTKSEFSYDSFSINTMSNFGETYVRNSFFELLKVTDPKLSMSIMKLLDEGIEYIKIENDELVRFKRIGEEEKILPKLSLLSILSSGTFRGYELYVRAAIALKLGKVLIVDEIENCFQKNLVNNLLILFNDRKTNPLNAQLFFSTHYVETLDIIERRDSIVITHKKDNRIAANKMIEYNIRPDKIKSIQLNNNSFDTSANYDQLMEVRRLIING